ncbi:PH domain-containing protein [Thermobifida halotolerans]|uniref:PH domain-containing protein n=2 Tax=Thermobifida halotolerans TaxID=483545 RepID=A0AA97M2F0_9ACTN|nr:PH domain-containing protein [Thermobifida halotolerans]
MGWAWMAVSVLLLVDLVVRGTDMRAVVSGAVLLITVGAAYVLAVRPKVVATEEGVRLVNPLREVFVPWTAFTWADVTDVLRVHAGDQVFRSWPLREGKRSEVRENLRRAGGFGEDRDDPREMRPTERVAWILRGEAERRRARSAGGAREGAAGPTVVWAPDAVAALAVPVVLFAGALLLI